MSSPVSISLKWVGVWVLGMCIHTHTHTHTHTLKFPYASKSRRAFIILFIVPATRPGKWIIYLSFYQWRIWTSKKLKDSNQDHPRCSKAGIKLASWLPRQHAPQGPTLPQSQLPWALGYDCYKGARIPIHIYGKTFGSTALCLEVSTFFFLIYQRKESNNGVDGQFV